MKPMSKKQVDFDNWGHTTDGPPRGVPGRKPDKGLASASLNWLSDEPRKVNQKFTHGMGKTFQ